MEIVHSAVPLGSNSAWSRLARVLGGESLEVVRNTIRHLRILDTQCYVIEEPYIDRDYSADYSQFYALTFQAHERHCRRVHFFSQNIAPLLQRPLSTDNRIEFRDHAKDAYCGFCVVRPLPAAPIGRTVLLARLGDGLDMEATVTCRAAIDAHLLGTQLQISGTSFLQQDSRVGACAQVAIWTGMRHMHERYDYNWVSVADITKFSGFPSETEAFSLPNSSDRLTSNSMVRAIAEAGYQPLCFPQHDIGHAILPYVESGIPVILGLNIGGTIGHAVTVIGRVFAKQENPTTRSSDYVPAYVVHDDQSGPYMWLPSDENASTTFSFTNGTIKRDTPDGIMELNVKCHAVFAVALMSTRVFSTAARAEHHARSRIDGNLKALPAVREALAKHGISVNEKLMDELQAAHAAGKIVLRTYLTSAAGYRHHLAQGSASDALKDALLHLHLPHFTWITEIFTIESFNHPTSGLRRVHGHTVLDATSTTRLKDALLVLHLPGLLLTQDLQARGKQQVRAIEGDKLYECREKRL